MASWSTKLSLSMQAIISLVAWVIPEARATRLPIVMLVFDEDQPLGEFGVSFDSLEVIPSLVRASVVNGYYLELGRGVVAVEHGSYYWFDGFLLILCWCDYCDFGPQAHVW